MTRGDALREAPQEGSTLRAHIVELHAAGESVKFYRRESLQRIEQPFGARRESRAGAFRSEQPHVRPPPEPDRT
jgi:hypothetical protein